MIKLNLLAVSVGNTRTRLGAFVDGQLVESATFENRQESAITEAMDHAFSPLRENDEAPVVMASVNPPAARLVEANITRHLKRTVKRVERDLPIPIGRRLDPEAIVGEDRLLNAAAAYDVLKQACVIIDAGTAITIDVVDGQGTFHGGAIAPGAQLQLDALHNRTAQLPEVEFDRPEEPIGHNTSQAMRCGVYHGLRGMVRELVETYAEHLGAYPMVVATGGDSPLLFRDYEIVDRVAPDLTLTGLAVTWRVAVEQENA
ncbi:MAG: type III pantothenate kinase [Phycisphaeraceae bacterium]